MINIKNNKHSRTQNNINVGPLLTVIVPLVMGRDGNSVGDLADDVELLNADLINLIEDVDAGDVGPVPFNHVDQLVRSGVAS